MESETTILLRRAVALRHTPEARAFWAAALDALTAGAAEPELACGLLCRAALEPAADSVRSWLTTLARAAGEPVDLTAVLRRADAVDAALSAVGGARGSVSRRLRVRVRGAVDLATAA